MTYQLPDLKNADVKDKTIFLRADLDVPLSATREIDDDTRLRASVPTIQYLLEKGAKVIIAGHLDRPKGRDESVSLKPVAEWLVEEFRVQNSEFRIQKFGEFEGWKLSENLILLENLRFYEGEEKNDPEFVKKLASLAEIFVNDAFAMSHRDHASVTGVAKLLSHFAGFHLQKEIRELSSLLNNPKRPLVVIIGGKKIETKLPLILKMYQIADYILVGGKIAQEKGEILQIQHEKKDGRAKLFVADSKSTKADITKESLDKFLEIIKLGNTIVWNGSMGVIGTKNENLESEQRTKELVEGIVANRAFKVVGGGDTVEFLEKIHMTHKFDFVSTGGGAMLAFLSGEKLPGLEALIQ